VNIFANTTNRTMNPENDAWRHLGEHAASQISSGFAERTLLAASQTTPSQSGQFFLSATTATLCVLTVVIFFTHATQAQNSQNLAGWHELAAAAVDDTGSFQ
jgi:hypothetical protein